MLCASTGEAGLYLSEDGGGADGEGDRWKGEGTRVEDGVETGWYNKQINVIYIKKFKVIFRQFVKDRLLLLQGFLLFP